MASHKCCTIHPSRSLASCKGIDDALHRALHAPERTSSSVRGPKVGSSGRRHVVVRWIVMLHMLRNSIGQVRLASIMSSSVLRIRVLRIGHSRVLRVSDRSTVVCRSGRGGLAHGHQYSLQTPRHLLYIRSGADTDTYF
jgi:hypothetical protein